MKTIQITFKYLVDCDNEKDAAESITEDVLLNSQTLFSIGDIVINEIAVIKIEYF